MKQVYKVRSEKVSQRKARELQHEARRNVQRVKNTGKWEFAIITLKGDK